jgi:ABC-type oligopeptide transport system ATPase subunit
MENQNITQTAQAKNAQSSYRNQIGILHVTRIAENQPTKQIYIRYKKKYDKNLTKMTIPCSCSCIAFTFWFLELHHQIAVKCSA